MDVLALQLVRGALRLPSTEKNHAAGYREVLSTLTLFVKNALEKETDEIALCVAVSPTPLHPTRTAGRSEGRRHGFTCNSVDLAIFSNWKTF